MAPVHVVFVVGFLLVCLVMVEVLGRHCTFVSLNKITPSICCVFKKNFPGSMLLLRSVASEQSSENFSACALMMTSGLKYRKFSYSEF